MTLDYFNTNCPLSCFDCHIKCYRENRPGPSYPQKDRSTAQKRRINKVLEKERANKTLDIVEAKYRKKCFDLLRHSNHEELDMINKKHLNVTKKAVRNKQTTMQIIFPMEYLDILEEIGTDYSIASLVDFLYDIRTNTEASDIDLICTQTIYKLETAQFYNGELVNTLVEENVINVTIGFYIKVNLSEYEKHFLS